MSACVLSVWWLCLSVVSAIVSMVPFCLCCRASDRCVLGIQATAGKRVTQTRGGGEKDSRARKDTRRKGTENERERAAHEERERESQRERERLEKDLEERNALIAILEGDLQAAVHGGVDVEQIADEK